MNLSKLKEWFKRTFEDYYVVEIYEEGKTKPRTFHMKYIKRIDNNSLRGKLLEGNEINFCTEKPFTYYVKKIY
jgi:hypothetical protein